MKRIISMAVAAVLLVLYAAMLPSQIEIERADKASMKTEFASRKSAEDYLTDFDGTSK